MDMIVIEATHWPLVVVGAVPPAAGRPLAATLDERGLWASADLRLAVVFRGDHACTWMAQAEVFAWLGSYREQLWHCVSRAAWIFEDELMRRSAERWLTLVGDRLFRGEVMTFRTVRTAVSWLTCETSASGEIR
jgi:hypothetical protein